MAPLLRCASVLGDVQFANEFAADKKVKEDCNGEASGEPNHAIVTKKRRCTLNVRIPETCGNKENDERKRAA